MTRDTDASVNDDWDGGLGDDDFDLFAGGKAFVGTDGCSEGHDCGAADFLEAFGKDRVCIDVGEDCEAFFHEGFSCFECFDGIRQQVGRIRVDLEFDPLREAGGVGEFRESDGFFGVHCAAGVCEEEVFLGIDEVEDVGEGVMFCIEVCAAQCDCDDFRFGGEQCCAHGFVGREFSGAEEEAGVEGTISDFEHGTIKVGVSVFP